MINERILKKKVARIKGFPRPMFTIVFCIGSHIAEITGIFTFLGCLGKASVKASIFYFILQYYRCIV